MRFKLSLILLGLILLTRCERDDICSEDTQTTPKLIIRFYDIANPDEFKSVPQFYARGIGLENPLGDYAGFSSNDSIALPLRTDMETTQYILHKNYEIDDNDTPDDTSDDIILGNQDIITINYQNDYIYVSRACGYKAIYNNAQLNAEPDSDNWILLSQPVNTDQSIENEKAAHFKIWH